MKQIIITENQLANIAKKLKKNKTNIKEDHDMNVSNYMFFGNIEQMHRQLGLLLELDPQMVDSILQNGHDWADDHISEAKTNIDQVFDFMMNEIKGDKFSSDDAVRPEEDIMMEGDTDGKGIDWYICHQDQLIQFK